MKLIDIPGESQADPYIIESGGKYYVYATGETGVVVYRASDLFAEWEKVGVCASVPGRKAYWAPSVIELDGRFYMYVSCMEDDTSDAHRQAMHALVADTPEGPFENARQILEPFSIDSHIVKNEAGLFLFYSVNDYEAERAGTYIVVDRMLDPYTPEGKPVPVVRPTLDEEIFQRDRFRPGQHWHTLEGAYYFREGNRHFVLYSGNCYENEYYYVGYAYAETEESDLTKIKFKKYPADDVYLPLLCKNDWEEGTGHNSVIKYKGDWYAVYHGRDWGVNDGRRDYRTARIARLSIDGIRLTAQRYKDRV